MLDRYLWGTATRLSPEAAVPVVDFIEQTETLGGAANVAANLASLGARVHLVGVVGRDEHGRALRRCMRNTGLSDKAVVADSSRPTTVKTRIIARHQQIVRLDHESRTFLQPALEKTLIRLVLRSLPRAKVLVISDYDKGVVGEELANSVLSACQRLGVPSLVKPKWSRLPRYSGATAIVLNRAEAGFLVTSSLDDDSSIEKAARALLSHFDCPAVIITRGEKGISVVEAGSNEAVHIPAVGRDLPFGKAAGEYTGHGGRQVFDVTGAGDTVLATLALSVAVGASTRDAAILANAAAGVVVGKLGTATLSVVELAAAIGEASAVGSAGKQGID